MYRDFISRWSARLTFALLVLMSGAGVHDSVTLGTAVPLAVSSVIVGSSPTVIGRAMISGVS